MYSLCFKLQLQMFMKEWERCLRICVCFWGVDAISELHKGSARFSKSSVQANLWTSLPLSFLIPPVSLLSLSSSTFLRRWQRKELSKAFTFWTFLAAILQTKGGRERVREGEKEVPWNPAVVLWGNAWPEGLYVSEVCQGGKASRSKSFLYYYVKKQLEEQYFGFYKIWFDVLLIRFSILVFVVISVGIGSESVLMGSVACMQFPKCCACVYVYSSKCLCAPRGVHTLSLSCVYVRACAEGPGQLLQCVHKHLVRV